MNTIIISFLAGIALRALKKDITVPSWIAFLLSSYILLSIGFKGGFELAHHVSGQLVLQMFVVMAMGVTATLFYWLWLRFCSIYSQQESIVLAAHYGSVSVATYAVAAVMLTTRSISFAPYFPLFVSVLEFPAIIVGNILLSATHKKKFSLSRTLQQVVMCKSLQLLLGAIFLGAVAREWIVCIVEPVFIKPFPFILGLFLFEMGIVVGSQLVQMVAEWRAVVTVALSLSAIGMVLGLITAKILHFGVGDTALLMTMGASASYIAVPASLRASTDSLSLSRALIHALGVSFPFNIMVGIPLYIWIAQILCA